MHDAPPIEVVVADGQPLFRDGLARAIRQDSGLQLLAEVGDGPGAMTAIERHRPQVVVVDAELPGLPGLRVLRAVQLDELRTRVVLLSGDVSGAAPYEAIQAGAAGVLSRRSRVSDVREAVRRAAAGRVMVCERAMAGLAAELRLRDPDGRSPLSRRELEVLRLVADGLSAPDIAQRLGVAARTVRTQLEHLFDKLGARDRAHLVAVAMRRGLLR